MLAEEADLREAVEQVAWVALSEKVPAAMVRAAVVMAVLRVLQVRQAIRAPAVAADKRGKRLPEHYDAAMNPARGKSKLLGFTVGPGKLAWNPLCPYAYEISFICPWNFENVPSGSVILVMIVLFL